MEESETISGIGIPKELASRSPDRLTLIAFGLFVFLGGAAPIAVRFTYAELAPFWSAAMRFGLAALIFWLLMLYRGVRLPRGRALLGALIFGTLSVGGAFLLVYYGLTRTGASLTSTITATVPLLTLFFAGAHKLEKIRRRGLVGGLLALTGIAISVGGSLFSGGEVSLPHVLAILAAAACFAEGGIVVKLFPPCHPYATNAVAMSTGTLILGAASLIGGESWLLPSSASVRLSLIYLVIASVGLFLLYLFILGRWTATGASYAFVLNPLVTVILATFLTDEVISLLFLVGAAVVLLGVYVGALMPGVEPAEPVREDIHARPAVPTCM
ncbi:MAG: DMT family transporter [Chloroflexota bacterium]